MIISSMRMSISTLRDTMKTIITTRLNRIRKLFKITMSIKNNQRAIQNSMNDQSKAQKSMNVFITSKVSFLFYTSL